jgi:hypothetical protein
MSTFQIGTQLWDAYGSSGTLTITDPGPGGTFNLNGRWGGVATIASGFRKLPGNVPLGIVVYVYATGSVTIRNQANAVMANIEAGQICEFVATSTTWVATKKAVGGTPLDAGDVEFRIDEISAITSEITVQSAMVGLFQNAGVQVIDVPLTALREVSTMAVGNIAANGGLLASDTTPILGPINGATAGCQRIQWASSNNDVVMFQVSLPANMYVDGDITLSARIASGGTTNAVGFTVTSYFGETGAAVTDTTGTNQTTTYSMVTATIAAADVVAASVLTVSLTPAAHTTDTLNLTGLSLSVPVLINAD